MSKKLIIIGAGGHGKVVFDVAKLNGYKEISFLDDKVISPAVVGKIKDCEKFSNGNDFFVAVGDNEKRATISKYLKEKNIEQTSLIHPSAVIGSRVKIANGVVIMANAVVNAGATIGEGVIINTSASVDHDSVIGNYTHVAVGSHLCGGVRVGDNCLLGVGSAVVNGVSIPSNTVIGAGGVVVKSLEKPGKYAGVPVKEIE